MRNPFTYILNKMTNKIQIIIIFIVIPLIAGLIFFNKQNVTIKQFFFSDTPIVYIGDTPIYVDIVDTDAERTLGLSGRDGFQSKIKGMLFVYPTPDKYGIWMKDMKFSIDIVWIDENHIVIGIDKDVSPSTYPKVFRPSKPVKYILETDGRYTDFVGISVGKELRIPLE